MAGFVHATMRDRDRPDQRRGEQYTGRLKSHGVSR